MTKRRSWTLISMTLISAVFPASASSTAAPTCLGKPATIVGSKGDDRLMGTRKADVIAGLGGDDVIVGQDGRDRICGDSGNDSMAGRYGHDVMSGGSGKDEASGGPGDDLLIGGIGGDHLLGGDGRTDSDTLVGGPQNDILSGGDGVLDEDYLFGGEDNDFLEAGIGGSDFLVGGSGNDYFGGEGSDTASFEFASAPIEIDLSKPSGVQAVGEGSDSFGQLSVLIGSRFDDTILDGDQPRAIRGGEGDDEISGAGGADNIDGGDGDDTLDGGDDEDTVDFTDSSAGVVVDLGSGSGNGPGVDSLSGFEAVVGSYFDDELTGTEARDSIYGSYGINNVFALEGNDYIEFAHEGDAGPGEDECIWASVANCERSGHFDPPGLPYISESLHQENITRLGTVRGATAGGVGGPRRFTVLVAIRRMTPNGCSWWLRGRFEVGGCGMQFATAVEPTDSGEWQLPVEEDLPAGSYEIGVTWQARRWRSWECAGAFAPMCIEFSVPS